MKGKTIAMGFGIFLVMFSCMALAMAQGIGAPHQFYGSVTVNGAAAADGTTVVAKMNGVQVASTISINGKYGYNPYIFYVDDPDGTRQGQKIEFFVSGVKAAESTFWSGESTELSLAITIAQPPSPPAGGGSSGGGGGSSSGSSSGSGSSVCNPDWQCSQWTQCVDNNQVRACFDVNKCNKNETRPAEEKECNTGEIFTQACTNGVRICSDKDVMECSNDTWSKIETCPGVCMDGKCVTNNSMTGFFLNPANLYLIVIVVIIIIGGLTYIKLR